MRIYWSLLIMFLISSVLFGAENSLLENSPVVPLTIKGDAYYNPQNRQVKFWGVNVVALYPSHETAVKIAADIASYGFNLVRPHHMMRPSLDWNTLSKITALVDYKSNTYTFDKEALDRFDFFNAELKKRGIYLALALRQSRNYLPADVDILSTDDKDRQDWIAAMNELNRWHWRKAIDARKLLPIFDERAAAVDMEFARRLLNHVNPYTGLAYGKDPQIISIEVINEATCEYSLICGVKERMPAYFQNKLQKRWEEFLKAKGVAFYNLWDASSREQTDMRTEFYRSLDQAYFARMKKFVRELGCNAPMLYTNLPHSEGNLKHQAQEAEVMETHCYDDPFVARAQKDMFKYLSKSQIKDKPLIIGELNEGEGNEKISQQQAYRTMLPVAMSAYGGLQNISGVVWFAWQHGDRLLDKDGNILPAGLSRDKARIGELMGDQMLLDHMRSCGIIFKNAFAASTRYSQPQAVAHQ